MWNKNIFLIFFGGLCLLSCSTKSRLMIVGDIPFKTQIQSIDDLHVIIDKFHVDDIFFVTKDLVAVEIKAKLINEVQLQYAQGKWNLSSSQLARSINLHDLQYIAVSSTFKDYQLAVFSGDQEQELISSYETLKKNFFLEGTAEKNGRTMKKYRGFPSPPSITVLEYTDKPIIAFVENGEQKIYDIDFLLPKMKFFQTHWQIDNDALLIIWNDFPQASISLVKHKLQQTFRNPPLLMMMIDGLGWKMLENARAYGDVKSWANVNFVPMRTLYPPTTTNTMQQLMNFDSQLQFRDSYSSSGKIIENDHVLYKSLFEIILNTDLNDNSTTDDEIFDSAKEHLLLTPRLLFVHFHSVDDTAHEFGPYHHKTRTQITIVEDYVQELIARWQGDYVIFSDHGLHSVEGKGQHGQNRIEDMVGVFYSSIDQLPAVIPHRLTINEER